jgi:hypothetical protein
MTAREMINELKFDPNEPIQLNEGQVALLIRRYAKQKCKEQRKICYKNTEIVTADFYGFRNAVVNAPEPEFD